MPSTRKDSCQGGQKAPLGKLKVFRRFDDFGRMTGYPYMIR
jgi:hypothetical protein